LGRFLGIWDQVDSSHSSACRKEGAIREFYDHFIRERMARVRPADCLRCSEAMPRLGKAGSGLKPTVELLVEIPLLGFQVRHVQRFFCWPQSAGAGWKKLVFQG
jgi:hypothetical protein